MQTFNPNFITRLVTSAMMGASVIFGAMPAEATLRNVGGDMWTAVDANGSTHSIQYVRQDHEGDVQVRVLVQGRGETFYWIDCTQDLISVGGPDFDGWSYVDHRKMEGYYSDVACRL